MFYSRSLYIWDLVKDRIKTTQSIQEVGDWQFIQLGNYTEVSPLNVTQGNKVKITFQEADISYTAGNGFKLSYNFTDQKFEPTQLNDLFFSEIRFKTKCSKQNGHASVQVEVPTATFSPVQATTFGIPKAANVEQFISLDGGMFVGQEMVDNGFEIYFEAEDGNFEIYDVSFLSSRLGSGK
ncbi:hypothetical protein NVP1161O_027 [Vibrio phage 1.161.O._10N.261.48.C5]|nr:hypothetical protein NVP1161O_027 [Vibrio phage 1.161.O._10N.261.48.C5]